MILFLLTVNQLVEDIGFNGLLMLLFVLQHSFTSRLSVIDNILSHLNMSSCSRALYTLTTCITIHVSLLLAVKPVFITCFSGYSLVMATHSSPPMALPR